MPRRRAEYRKPPEQPDKLRLVNADGVRWYIANHIRWGFMTDAQLAKEMEALDGICGDAA